MRASAKPQSLVSDVPPAASPIVGRQSDRQVRLSISTQTRWQGNPQAGLFSTTAGSPSGRPPMQSWLQIWLQKLAQSKDFGVQPIVSPWPSPTLIWPQPKPVTPIAP